MYLILMMYACLISYLINKSKCHSLAYFNLHWTCVVILHKNKSGNKHFKDLNTKHDSVFTFHEIYNMDIVKVIYRVHAKLLKLMKDALVELLKLIINQTFINGTFPDNLNIVKVIPIFTTKKKIKKHFSQTIGQFSYYLLSQTFFFKIIVDQLYSFFDNKLFFIKVSMDLRKDIQQSLLHLN